jgi:hypothetical protein
MNANKNHSKNIMKHTKGNTKAKFSDGKIEIDGKIIHKSFIQVPNDFFVCCPFCGIDQDCDDDSELVRCEKCGEIFYAEFDKSEIL